MGQTTKIEWCDHTFNPVRGCAHAVLPDGSEHPGCAHCYAEAMSKRNPKTLGQWGPDGVRVCAAPSYWGQPHKWNAAAANDGVRRRVFCASLADIFESWDGPIADHLGNRLLCCDTCGGLHSDTAKNLAASCPCGRFLQRTEWATMDDLRTAFFQLIDKTPSLDWLLLTKRPANVWRMWPLTNGTNEPVGIGAISQRRENVWIGTSVSDQATADKQIPELLQLRALTPVLFLSAEPLLGAIDLHHLQPAGEVEIDCLRGTHGVHRPHRGKNAAINWCIVGGESGPHARPMHPQWARDIRDQCQAAEVAFHFKQHGEWLPFYDRDIDDPDWRNVPEESSKIQRINLAGNQGFHGIRVVYFNRVGKHAAGRLLDGDEYSEFPAPAATERKP